MALDIFNKRGREDREKFGERLPPGQKLTDGWPVLHYGAIPEVEIMGRATQQRLENRIIVHNHGKSLVFPWVIE